MIAKRPGKNSDEVLQHGSASFETRPPGAPQDNRRSLMALRIPHPEEAVKAAFSKIN
jgi:hypothetical protein